MSCGYGHSAAIDQAWASIDVVEQLRLVIGTHRDGDIAINVEKLMRWMAALTALTATHARELDEAVNEVWEDVLRSVAQAWPEKQSYCDSPLELVSRVIDERDELKAALAVALGYVTHKADCEVVTSRQGPMPIPTNACTCGAAAVLSQKGPST